MGVFSLAKIGRPTAAEIEGVVAAAWRSGVRVGLIRFGQRISLPLLGLATLLGVIAAAMQWTWAGVLCWVLVAGVDWLATRSDSQEFRLMDYAGFQPFSRFGIRTVWAFALVAGSGISWTQLAGYLINVAIIAACWLLLITLVQWLSIKNPPMLFQPGESPQSGIIGEYAKMYLLAVGTPGSIVMLEAAALLFGIIHALPFQILWLPAVAALGYAGVKVLTFLRLRRSVAADTEQIVAALSEQDPRFIFYVSMAAGMAKYIVGQWHDALQTTAVPGFLIVREASQLPCLLPGKHPVVYAPLNGQVDQLILPSVRAVLYAAYGERNSYLLRNPSLKHVMILHGDSDKASSTNAMARCFDEIWVSGPMGRERYRTAGIDIPDERFVTVGRPQVAGLQVGSLGNDVKTVLYAPTFEGYSPLNAYSSLLAMGPALIAQILQDFPDVKVWFKTHPATGSRIPALLVAKTQIEEMLRQAGGGHVVVADHPELNLDDCFQNADVLIADVSAVASDFLYTERPILACNPFDMDASQFKTQFPSLATCYLVDATLETLRADLTDALGVDSLAGERRETKRLLFGDLPDGPLAAFDAALVALVSQVSQEGQ